MEKAAPELRRIEKRKGAAPPEPRPSSIVKIDVVLRRHREIVGGGLAGPLVLDDLVVDLLPLIEAVQARALNSGNVHEHVRPALVGLNEAVALLPVEPFYSAGSHISPSRSPLP